MSTKLRKALKSEGKKTCLGVKHDGDNIVFCLGIIFFNQINNFLMWCMVSMGHIKTSNIHSSLCQLPYHLPGVGWGANCANNFCLAPDCGLWPHTNRCVTELWNPLYIMILLFSLVKEKSTGMIILNVTSCPLKLSPYMHVCSVIQVHSLTYDSLPRYKK